MRQRQHDVRRDPPRIARRQFGVAVVQQMQRLHAFGFVGQIGRAMRRQDLRLDAGRIHQLQPPLDVGRRIRHRVFRDAGRVRHADARREAIAHEVAERLRQVMRMDVTDHRFPRGPVPHWTEIAASLRSSQ
jgi:hypothetical protein